MHDESLNDYGNQLHEQKSRAAQGMNCVTCNKCGSVHFAVTREFAELEVKTFNEFYDKANPATKEMYGNHRSSIYTYEHCMLCGNTYKDFRPSKDGDCPVGCTLAPLIQD